MPSSSGMFTAEHSLKQIRSLAGKVDIASQQCIFPHNTFGKAILVKKKQIRYHDSIEQDFQKDITKSVSMQDKDIEMHALS
jgi:hypothetical protein